MENIKTNGFSLNKRVTLPVYSSTSNIYLNKRSFGINSLLNPVTEAGSSSAGTTVTSTVGGVTNSLVSSVTNTASNVTSTMGNTIGSAVSITTEIRQETIAITSQLSFEQIQNLGMLMTSTAAAIMALYLSMTLIWRGAGLIAPYRPHNLLPPNISELPSSEVRRMPEDYSVICDSIEDIRDQMIELANQNLISELPPNYIIEYSRIMQYVDILHSDIKDMIDNSVLCSYLNWAGDDYLDDYINWEVVFQGLLDDLWRTFDVISPLFG